MFGRRTFARRTEKRARIHWRQKRSRYSVVIHIEDAAAGLTWPSSARLREVVLVCKDYPASYLSMSTCDRHSKNEQSGGRPSASHIPARKKSTPALCDNGYPPPNRGLISIIFGPSGPSIACTVIGPRAPGRASTTPTQLLDFGMVSCSGPLNLTGPSGQPTAGTAARALPRAVDVTVDRVFSTSYVFLVDAVEPRFQVAKMLLVFYEFSPGRRASISGLKEHTVIDNKLKGGIAVHL